MDETNKSTVSNVRLVRSDINKVDNATIQLAIDDAWIVVARQRFPTDVQEQACRYLAASLLAREDAGVALKQVGDLKKQYFKGTNPWYDRYLELLREFGNGGSLRFVVV